MSYAEILAALIRKLEILEAGEIPLKEGIQSTERAIYNELIKLYDRFITEKGKLVKSRSQKLLLADLEDRIFTILQRSTYKGKIEKYLKLFPETTRLNKIIHTGINGVSFKGITNDVNTLQKKAIKDLSSKLIDKTRLKSDIVNPIAEIMRQDILSGVTLKEAKEKLRKFITDNGQGYGFMRQHVHQIASDSVSLYNGKVNHLVATEYELDAYRYVGSIVTDSRPQCIRWVNHNNGELTKEFLESDLYRSGDKGMIPGTTVDNFPIYRGGYNCGHEAIPYRSSNESAAEILNDIQKDLNKLFKK